MNMGHLQLILCILEQFFSNFSYSVAFSANFEYLSAILEQFYLNFG